MENPSCMSVPALVSRCSESAEGILSALLATSGPVCVIGCDYHILHVNETLSQNDRLASQEVLGQKCFKVFQWPECHTAACPLAVLGGDGTLVDHTASACPCLRYGRTWLDSAGVPGGIVVRLATWEAGVVCEDQRNLAEQLARTNQELQDFAYIVSHDLKAPLRGIRTLVEWLSADYRDSLDSDGQEQLSLLGQRVERMHNLIDGVLQYSRIGRLFEDVVPVDLSVVVPEIVDLLAPPETITIEIETALPTIVFEQTRIGQVFQNLLSNAIKYMDKPAGHIRVGCQDQNDQWAFYVADNGPGIHEDHYERIFRIFQTLQPKDEFESTGVGLTLVKKIVESYGGHVAVESQVGQGSTFWIYLPKDASLLQTKSLDA